MATIYAPVRLSDHTLIGAPGPLPANLLGLSDAVLADLSAAIKPAPPGLDGMGLWPVALALPAGFDPASQVSVDPASYTVDLGTRTVAGQQTARAMTDAEFAAAHPVPDIISDRQCFQQLAILGRITQDEALAAVTVGALPKVVTDGIAGLPAGQQFAAKMMLCGATQFQRSNPMTPVLGSFLSLDAGALDALWRAASLL